jgi:hypothetical protein
MPTELSNHAAPVRQATAPQLQRADSSSSSPRRVFIFDNPMAVARTSTDHLKESIEVRPVRVRMEEVRASQIVAKNPLFAHRLPSSRREKPSQALMKAQAPKIQFAITRKIALPIR